MNRTFKNILDLSPQERRALLVQFLRGKVNDPTWLLEQLTTSVRDMANEACLDSTIRLGAVSVEPVTEPGHIFLTGATGFLGAFLLHDLLQQTQAEVHCLVRAANVEEGHKKLQRTLDSYVLGHADLSSRIIPVPGDLTEPQFGLSAQQFQTLASRIDTIYHNGASVNWVYPYSRLKPANVLGTQEVLRLACQVKVKPVHFISTLSVFPLIGKSQATIVREEDSLDHDGDLYGGYVQSKWVAEKLVTIARSRGLPVCIYRPGLIIGHSQTGAWNTDDVTCRMIKSWIELGEAPDLNIRVHMTPVDYVSQAIVHLSRQQASLGKAFHLVNPSPVQLRELVTWIRNLDYPLKPIQYDQWRATVIKLAMRSREDAVNSIVPMFLLSAAEEVPSLMGRMPDFDSQNTLLGLAGTSIVCPLVDDQTFETYFSYFIRCGFLAPPPSVGKPAP